MASKMSNSLNAGWRWYCELLADELLEDCQFYKFKETRDSTLSASIDLAPRLDSRACAFWCALCAAASGSRTGADRWPTGWSAGRPWQGRRVPWLGSACLDPLAVLALRAYGYHG